MKRQPIIHKMGREHTEQYAGFGQYIKLPVPLCVTPAFIWKTKRQMYMHRQWKYVTCKNCLNRRSIKSVEGDMPNELVH